MSKDKQEFQEDAGWASAFLRDVPDGTGRHPRYTGEGLSPNGHPIQVSVWPKIARSGARYLRIHIEPPYQPPEGSTAAEEGDATGGVPFG